VLGILMYLGIKVGFSAAALCLGHILGNIVENGLLLGVRIGTAKGSVLAYFFTQPLSIVLIALCAGSLLLAFWFEWREKRTTSVLAEARPPLFRIPSSLGLLNMRQLNGISALLLIALAAAILVGAGNLNSEAALFPKALAVILAICAVCLLVGVAVGKGSAQESKTPFAGFPGKPILISIVILTLYIILAGKLGFYCASFVFMLAMPFFLLKPELRKGKSLQVILVAVLFSVVLYLAFAALLMVPTPKGVFL